MPFRQYSRLPADEVSETEMPNFQERSSSSPPQESFLLSEEETEKPRGPLSWPRLASLTCSIFCVSMFWSILMAHGTPYLQSLGVSRALTSIVWMAGPLGGAVLSPIFGQWSDSYVPQPNSLFARLGRRKPFILLGASGTAACLFAFSTVKETCDLIGQVLGYNEDELDGVFGPSGRANWIPVILAITWVYLLNIFIISLQVGLRSFIVDCVSPEQQKSASAWVSRWSSFSAVATFWLGSVDLASTFPSFGENQFRSLAIIEIFCLAIAIPVTIVAGARLERSPLAHAKDRVSVRGVFINLYANFKALPHISWKVFQIQFWSWLAWFPFLYYHTAYVGSLAYEQSDRGYTSSATPDLTDKHGISEHQATQIGSYASFLFALAALVFSFILPWASQYSSFLTVERIWMISHILFAAATLATVLIRSYQVVSLLFACIGFSWAVTQWVPFAIISTEVSQKEAQAAEDREAGRGSGDGSESQRASGAGAALGLLNMSMGIPQIISAIATAGLLELFGALQVGHEIGWALRCAGLTVIGAIWINRGLID